ncbi:hypothetical protein BHE74_00007003, partial [Ensete ventricosum]
LRPRTELYCSLFFSFFSLFFFSFFLFLPQSTAYGRFQRYHPIPGVVFTHFFMLFYQLHLGVNSGATRFAIENQAVNEATFRCPDEMGWKPQVICAFFSHFPCPLLFVFSGQILKEVKVETDRSLMFLLGLLLQTSLPVNEIVKSLSKMGYDVMPSDDAGRFVCNFVYYHSLRFAEHNRIKSLFVHVPLFSTIDEETQMEFVASLLKVLASLH